MKLPVDDLRVGFQQRRGEAGAEGRPAKRSRRPTRDETDRDPANLPTAVLVGEQGAPGIPAAIALASRQGEGAPSDAQRRRGDRAAPEADQGGESPLGQAGEAGEVPLSPARPVEVVDLEAEEEHPAPAPVAGAAVPRAAGSAESRVGGSTPGAGLGDEEGPVDAGEEGSVARTQSQSSGLPAGVPRPAPRFHTMEDGGQAERLLMRLRRGPFFNELRQVSMGGVCDGAFVSLLQLVNEVFTLRDGLVDFTSAASRHRDRANAFRAQRDELAGELDAVKAREAETADKLLAAEKRLEEVLADAEDRCDSAEARARHAEERARSADLDARKAAEKVTETSLKLGEAEGRASAAEARARSAEEAAKGRAEAEEKARVAEEKRAEAEDRARAADERARKAVEDFQSSPEFQRELREMGVDAYEKGFEDCERKVEQVLGLDVLERLQAGEQGGKPGPSEP